MNRRLVETGEGKAFFGLTNLRGAADVKDAERVTVDQLVRGVRMTREPVVVDLVGLTNEQAAILNQRREVIKEQGARLVFVAPDKETLKIFFTRAPDLWHICDQEWPE